MTKRRLVIEGNAVYELDEDCILKKEQEKREECGRKGERYPEIERYKSSVQRRLR